MDEKDITYYNTQRLDILQHIPNNINKVLDVGCGTGSLGEAIKLNFGKHIEVIGIDCNPKASEIAKSKIDKIIIGDVENISIPYDNEYFDCIIYADVLEHLINPWEILTKHKSKLAYDGCIIASIPNIAHYKIIKMLKKGLWKYEDAGILDKTHLRFFTKATILELFSQAGLTPRIIDKILQGNEYWRLKQKIFNDDSCVIQFIIKATQNKFVEKY